MLEQDLIHLLTKTRDIFTTSSSSPTRIYSRAQPAAMVSDVTLSHKCFWVIPKMFSNTKMEKTLISINSLAKLQLWKWSKYLSSNNCVVMETAARRCLLRRAVPRLWCCQAPVLCSTAPQQRLESGSPQHPARAAPEQVVSEVNGESSINSQRTTAIYAKAILTYFAYK